MRLRPSGKQGPVAVSFEAFQSYQRNEAWTWEHLALTRARPVGGSAGLGAEVASFCQTLLSQAHDAGEVRADTEAMRERLAAAHPPTSPWDVKLGRGRLQDIELAAAAATLIAGKPATGLEDQLGNIGDAAQRQTLSDAARLFWPVRLAARLLAAGPLDESTANLPLVLRESGARDADDLRARLDASARSAAAAVDALLGPG